MIADRYLCGYRYFFPNFFVQPFHFSFIKNVGQGEDQNIFVIKYGVMHSKEEH